jgi:hypothetical protein
MRKGVLSAVGGALLAAVVALSAAPAQAVPLSAPAALKSARDAVDVTTNVCWDCGYGGPRYYRPYYRPYYGYGYHRPYYGYGYHRSYYGYGYHRPYYGYGYGYHRPYYGHSGYGYGCGDCNYGYRPEPWVSGPYYLPRPRFYVGPFVYGY